MILMVEMVGGPDDGRSYEIPSGSTHLKVLRPRLDGSGGYDELTFPIEINVRTGKSFVRWKEQQ